jgi:hypothetical protein
VRELDEHLGPYLDVRARVEQQERLARDGDHDRQRGPVDAAHALEAERRGGQGGAGGTAAHHCVGLTAGDGGARLHDRGLRGTTDRPDRVGVLRDRHRGVDHGDVVGHRPDLGRRAEQHDPDALCECSTARDFSGTEIGPVDVYGDGDAASARDRDRARRARARLRDRRRTRSCRTRGADGEAVGTAGSR